MTPFDIIAGLLLLVSGVTGWVRGASRELTSALSFIFAAAIALFGLRISGPIFRKLMDPDWAATGAAVLVVFVVFFLIFRLIGGRLTESLQQSSAGMLDRAIGATFGAIRACVVLGVFNLLLHLATPPDRMPHWVKDSMFYPLSEASGQVLKVFAPKGKALAGKLAPAIKEAVHEGGDNTSGEKSSGKGYDENQRRQMDDLVEKSR
ncbi:CvpA family protein [Caulobacter sp. RL271]|uniref:CvpA family protein n=1 Tax=Caulobacter segnis TaxID=88688 RepID=A0ABY4ZMR8_9CAUL|nr:CvpA family protein [Caulobacter segnis]USQ93866.1 CvpA family protein [Caulobacter segnis]